MAEVAVGREVAGAALLADAAEVVATVEEVCGAEKRAVAEKGVGVRAMGRSEEAAAEVTAEQMEVATVGMRVVRKAGGMAEAGEGVEGTAAEMEDTQVDEWVSDLEGELLVEVRVATKVVGMEGAVGDAMSPEQGQLDAAEGVMAAALVVLRASANKSWGPGAVAGVVMGVGAIEHDICSHHSRHRRSSLYTMSLARRHHRLHQN